MDEPNVSEVWGRVCDRLKEVLQPDVYSRWIAVIEPVAMDGTRLTLAVDNDFYQSWLEENYLPLIKDAIGKVCSSPLEVAFAISPKAGQPVLPEQAKKKKSLKEQQARPSRPEAALNARYTFDSFVVGPSNSFAHAASLAVAQAPARAYNPLFIYGDVGLGKTHLMQAIGHHALANSRASVRYLSSETMLNEYIDALQNRTIVQFRKKYRSADLLLIDDIHFLAGKERLQEEFFHTFNALFDAHKQIVMTSDRSASELMGLDKRLVSRFEWGLVTELEPPDLETRIAILRHKQASAGTALPDEFLFFIAKNIRSNIRRLEGALVRAISYSSLTGRKLTIESLATLLRDAIDKEKEVELTFDSIQRAVAEHYDVRLADMSSKRRHRSVALPRQVAMYLCRRMTRSSFPDIANAFGKTHATILHAYRAINGRVQLDQALKDNVASISKKLGKPVA